MPAAINLRGQRFGRLVAMDRAMDVKGRRAWICRCDCGRDTTVVTTRLSSVADDDPRAIRACETCRSRSCAICGQSYLKSGSAVTCGADHCRSTYRRIKNTEWRALEQLRYPERAAQRRHRQAEIVKTDPVRLAAARERNRMYALKYRSDLSEDQKSKRRMAARIAYWENRDERRAYYRAWLDAMPEERLKLYRLAGMENQRAMRSRRALASLMTGVEKLLNRKNQDEN